MMHFLYPIILLLFIPTIFGAPTMRPRQFPTVGFPTMDFDFPTGFPDFTGFDTSFPDFTGFDTKLPDFTGFDTKLPDFTGFDTKLPDFTGFDTHLPTGFPTRPNHEPPASTTRPTTAPAPVNVSPTSTSSRPNNSQDSKNPSAPSSSPQTSLSPSTSGSTDTEFYDPFYSWDTSPALGFGAILGIVFGCLGGFTVLFILYYLYYQHNKQARSLERQLAFAASNNNNNRGSQQCQQQYTTTTATATATATEPPSQQTEFNYGAHYQPYQPYREQPSSPQPQPPSYPEPMYGTHHSQNDTYHHHPQQPPPTFPIPTVATIPGHPTFESYPMANMPDHRHQQSTTPLNEATTASNDVYPPAPPYEHLAPKPDAVASPTMSPNQSTDGMPTTTAAASSSSHSDKTYNGDTTTDKPHSRN